MERETLATGEGANLLLPSLPPVACFALHAFFALAFARLKNYRPAGHSSVYK